MPSWVWRRRSSIPEIFGPDGFKLPDDVEKEIESLVLGSDLDKKRPTGTRVGRAERLDDAPGRYVAFVKASFPSNQPFFFLVAHKTTRYN